MPFKGKITAIITNGVTGPGNLAEIGFSFDTAESAEQCGAQVALYLAGMPGIFAPNTGLLALKRRNVGAAGSSFMAFPAAQFASERAKNTSFFANPMTDYSTFIGNGATYAPQGTSICVTEGSATVGRRGSGRHFLPFTSQDVIEAFSGRVAVGPLQRVKDSYRKALGIEAMTGTVFASPVNSCITGREVGGVAAPYLPVTNVRPSSLCSNLSSRRR